MRPSRFLPFVLLGCVSVVGCDQVIEALSNRAESMVQSGFEASPDDQLGMKLDAYIGCINNATMSVRRSADRYFDWVDPEAGLTGNEKNVFGLYAVNDQSACIDAVARVAEAEPRDAELEEAGAEFVQALQAATALIDEAHKYYDQQDYKDDSFAKGKELHPKLTSAFEAFGTADKKLRGLVVVKNDALLARELDRIEKELGQKLRWHQAKVMAVAKHLVEVTDAHIDHGKLVLDASKFEPSFKEFEEALEALQAYTKANKAETDSVTLFSSFTSAATDFQKAGKEMLRRHRDGTEFSETEIERLSSWPDQVEGNPIKFIKKYDELVMNSNRLNWHFYKPNG